VGFSSRRVSAFSSNSSDIDFDALDAYIIHQMELSSFYVLGTVPPARLPGNAASFG
jgi:hypothetical protein